MARAKAGTLAVCLRKPKKAKEIQKWAVERWLREEIGEVP